MSALLILCWLGGCAKPADVRHYEHGQLRLAAAFAAKETCSCRFVMGRDEAFCDAWTRVSPDVTGTRVDEAEGVVTARALGLTKATARYIDDQLGCVLDPP